jgi:hypothetical protein
MKILLDYVFPISVIEPTPQASTAFLKQVCVVAKPKSGQEGNVGNIYPCVTMTEVAARTDNENAQQLFNAGMSKVYVLLADDLDLESFLADGAGSDFYTLLVSDDFGDDDIAAVVETSAVKATKVIGDLTFTAKTAGTGGNSISVTLVDDATAGAETAHASGNAITIHMEDGVSTANQVLAAINESVSVTNLVSAVVAAGQGSVAQSAASLQNLSGGAAAITSAGTGVQVGNWEGVIGTFSSDASVCADQAAITRRCGFYGSESNGAKNMFYAFGKLLSNLANWTNQQYIAMPYNDDVENLGTANSLFDDKVSFVIHDDEFSDRLGLFAAGGKAIAAPYILKNLRVDLQSKALQWISANQPAYTKTQASLLETRLSEDVIKVYVEVRKWIEAGTVAITLINDNFVANGAINVSEPKALWRVFSEMRQTL